MEVQQTASQLNRLSTLTEVQRHEYHIATHITTMEIQRNESEMVISSALKPVS